MPRNTRRTIRGLTAMLSWLIALLVLSSTDTHGATVCLRLSKNDDILKDYYDHPNDFPFCRQNLDFISFSSAIDPLILPNHERLFATNLAASEIFKGNGKKYAFDGSEVVEELAAYEAQGLEVRYAILYREDWLFRKGPGGPFTEDIRIISENELAQIRQALRDSTLKVKDSVKLIQLVGARVKNYRGDSWSSIVQNEKLMQHLANFDGLGIECHIGDHVAHENNDDGPKTLDCMAEVTKWAKDHEKNALIFMGGTPTTYAGSGAIVPTYNYLWKKMAKLGVNKTDDHLIYFRQGARAGKHLPESEKTLTNQVKWLIEQVAPQKKSNTAPVASP